MTGWPVGNPDPAALTAGAEARQASHRALALRRGAGNGLCAMDSHLNG